MDTNLLLTPPGSPSDRSLATRAPSDRPVDPGDALASTDTALDCLARIGIEHGVYVQIDAVKRRNLIEDSDITLARLTEIAGEFGLRARCARLGWEALKRTAGSGGRLALLLENKNVVILLGLRRDNENEVAICDPLHRDGEAFFLSRSDLEHAWKGDVLITTRAAAGRRRKADLRLFLVRVEAACRAVADARRRGGRPGDARDRFVGTDLFPDPRRQSGAQPDLYDALPDNRRRRRADPVRRRLQLSAQLSARVHHAQDRPPGRHRNDRASADIADRLFPRQPVRGHRLQAAGGQQRPRVSRGPSVQHVPRFPRDPDLRAGIADLFLEADT